jgi:spore germination cell wall hydrolase CwlJ-like protein
MSRKTWIFSALGVIASANIVVSDTGSAELKAQDAADQAVAIDSGDDAADELIELVPETIPYISDEVVQPLPQPAMPDKPARASSLGELVGQMKVSDPLSEEMHCLASAVYFESRGEPLAGQLAVAQVVINRADDGRFPASYCGVVYQKSQFSFVKNGRMPQPRTGTKAWADAIAIARIAHQGLWQSEASDAVFFHATYVRPDWSHRKTRLAQISTHVFYR